jgi:single-stranded DNA-binding protein
VNSVPSIGNLGYLANGSEIAVTGRLHHRAWEDGEHKRERIEVVAGPPRRCSPRRSRPRPADDYAAGVDGAAQDDEYADDIPF